MKRLLTMVLLSVLAGMAAARPLAASCSMFISPNPLVLFSYDYFDPYYDTYQGTQGGTGIMYATSAPPDCVQVQWQGVELWPLMVLDWRPHIYWSQFGYGDWGRFQSLYFYPYFVAGELYVFGWDYGTSQPFAGEGVISLTVFKVYW